MSISYQQFENDNMRKNPDNYKWGIFYYNPNDKRLFLPKRNVGMGWTMNFANPWSYFIILIFVSMIFLGSFLTI